MGAVAVVRVGAEVTNSGDGVMIWPDGTDFATGRTREDCGDCSHCLMCGCDRDDHVEPDPYDMGNAELDAAGHLNHCGDCAQCFGPEFAPTGREEKELAGRSRP